MTSAVVYLSVRSVRNRLAWQAGRLGSVRYLLALLLGGLYVWFVLAGPRAAAPQRLPIGPWLEVVGAVGLTLMILRWWLVETEQLALAFSPAEVQFLFPAPVSRRGLIHFKLLRAQFALLLNTVIWTVFLRPGEAGTSPWPRAIALWILFSTLFLHRLGATLTRASLAQHGLSAARRRGVTLAVFGLALLALGVGLVDQWGEIQVAWAAGPLDGLQAFRRVLDRPWPRLVLLPFRLLFRPLTARGLDEWWKAIGPAAGILLVHYAWVLRSDAAFEEAALEASARRARRLEASRSGGVAQAGETGARRAWFRLAPSGWPAGAIIWKNLTAVTRRLRPSLAILLLVLGFVIVLPGAIDSDATAAQLFGTAALIWAVVLVVFGPQWVRNDLRLDLRRLDLLRSYPLTGRTIIVAEVISSALVLTGLELALLLAGYLGFLGETDVALSPLDRTALLMAVALVLPFINLLTQGLQNAGAVLYPEWVKLDRRPGIEGLGQNMLTRLISLLLLAVALLAPVALGGGLWFLLRDRFGLWAVLPGATVVAAGVGLEAFLLLDWLGTLFQRMDPSQTGRRTS